MDLRTLVTIRLQHGLHHDGIDYASGETLELPAHQAIGYVKQGRAVAIDALPGVPPLTMGAVMQADPNADHGDPGGEGAKGAKGAKKAAGKKQAPAE